MIVIFSQSVTARLRFVLDELLKVRVGTDYVLVHTYEEMYSAINNGDVVVIYDKVAVDADCIHIPESGLLFESGIHKQHIHVTPHQNWHYCLGNFNATTHGIPFDLFSAAFYLLSRYEEYTDVERDPHGRFMASSSLAGQSGFLQLPLIDLWCQELKQLIRKRYPNYQLTETSYHQLTTVDVDFAYYYRGIGPIKWWGRLIQSVAKLHIRALMQQFQAGVHEAADPYYTYPLFHQSGHEVAYFFLMSSRGGYDKNINPESNIMKQLLQNLQTKATFIGLHPSYASNEEPRLVHEEKALLESHLKAPVTASRQHFLKLNLPATLQQLETLGIQHDYSLMYAETPGFRASTCMPFRFFDLSRERVGTLLLHPTCFMDTTVHQYQKGNEKTIKEEVLGMKTLIKKLNGHFITLWHNNNFVRPAQLDLFQHIINDINLN